MSASVYSEFAHSRVITVMLLVSKPIFQTQPPFHVHQFLFPLLVCSKLTDGSHLRFTNKTDMGTSTQIKEIVFCPHPEAIQI